LRDSGKHSLALLLHDNAGLVRYAPPELAIRATKPLPGDFARDLAVALKGLTSTAWQVTLTDDIAQPSLREQDEARETAARNAVLATPPVQAAIAAFPDAELIGYKHHEDRSIDA
jgi:DNA polymerase-3 subunit gamma/tau